MKVRILGSGTSSGVPRIGGDWGLCDPDEHRNARSRASILVWTDTTRILVDTSPDMRAQLLYAGVATFDAVIWTHDHADHTHGIDDLRQVYHAQGAPVRGLARDATLTAIRERFGYAFLGHDGYPPTIAAAVLPPAIRIGDIDLHVVDQPHGTITSAGLRFEGDGRSLVYATDFNEMTAEMQTLYEGADCWIVDALRRRPHPTHPHLAQVVDWTKRFGIGRTALVHMDQTMDYATLASELPPGMVPGHDGLEIVL